MLPLTGTVHATLVSVTPYSMHDLPHYELRFRWAAPGCADEEETTRVAAEQVEGEPKLGDEVVLTLFFRQVQKVEPAGRGAADG